MNYKDLRKEYILHQLDPDLMVESPIDQFRNWFDEAISAHANEANAMVLSTVSKEGRPSSRYLLLKEISERGFVFFTNYKSRKALEMDSNPYVCLVFYWRELERQVRIEGRVEKISVDESEEYFNSRPMGSRISAIASPQSQSISNRKVLEDKIKFTRCPASNSLRTLSFGKEGSRVCTIAFATSGILRDIGIRKFWHPDIFGKDNFII